MKPMTQPPDVIEAIRKLRMGEGLSDEDRSLLRKGPRQRAPKCVKPRVSPGDAESCTRKRGWPSEAAAKRALPKRAGFRAFIYRCPSCRQFHVANAGKRDPIRRLA